MQDFSMLGADKKKEKQPRPPKPGSKKAQLLSTKVEHQFKLPEIYTHETTVFLIFKNQKDLKLALERVHHHYEKMVLNGPLKGINMPFCVYNEWKNTVELTEFESKVCELLEQPLYLIACLSGDRSTLLHEWAHAYYYSNSEFRLFITDEWNGLDPKTRLAIQKELKLRNYDESVFEDEFQAYILESPSDFGKKLTGTLSPLHLKLKEMIKMPNIFNKE